MNDIVHNDRGHRLRFMLVSEDTGGLLRDFWKLAAARRLRWHIGGYNFVLRRRLRGIGAGGRQPAAGGGRHRLPVSAADRKIPEFRPAISRRNPLH